VIALDTNALVRLLIEDNPDQARAVQTAVSHAEANSQQVLILSEVLIETVWVLESVYGCQRNEIANFLDTLMSAPTYAMPDKLVVQKAAVRYREGKDFADLIIVEQAKKHQAQKLLSFDKKLQKMFPDFVVADVSTCST
jgi:predicted nucleic-acid-binding protein